MTEIVGDPRLWQLACEAHWLECAIMREIRTYHTRSRRQRHLPALLPRAAARYERRLAAWQASVGTHAQE